MADSLWRSLRWVSFQCDFEGEIARVRFRYSVCNNNTGCGETITRWVAGSTL